MKRFSILLAVLAALLFGFSGCDKKPVDGVKQMHWDRDMCERCKMAISDRKFAVQIIDPQNGKGYKFDDLGCAVLWMDEEKIPWKGKAVIWVTDAKSGKWIDARKAEYVGGAITPMAYGFAAYTEQTLPKGAKVYTFREVVKKIAEKEASNDKHMGRE